jgi:VanZ family protein
MMKFWWGLGVVLLVVALVLCLMPMPTMPRAFDLNDKLLHILGHTALAVYFTGLVERRRWWKIFVLLLLFGVVVEFAQHYMNMGRHGDVRDVLGNAAGCLLGLLLGFIGLSRWPAWAAQLAGQRVAP